MVVVVNYPGRKGGGAVYSLEMAKAIFKKGFDVYAIVSRQVENLEKWRELPLKELILIDTYSNNVNFIINSLKFYFFELRKIKSRFRNIKVDAVFVPMIQPWSGLINSIFKRAQIVVTLHDPIPHKGSSFLLNIINELIAKKANDIIILSETFRQYCIKKFRMKNERIHYIPHGDFRYYKLIKSDISPIKYEKDKINFLFFGRITRYKGLHILIKAYRKLSEEFDCVTLTIAGDGDLSEYRDELSELKNLTIVNRWIRDEEVGSFFDGENVITIIPYTEATQSGVIPIAMEFKSLIIATRTGGIPEQIKNNYTGYLVEPNDPFELYRVMKYVIENIDKQKTIIENAYNHILRLSWDRIGEKLNSIILSKYNNSFIGKE